MAPLDETPEPRASILLVDDQPANLLALEALLADLGHQLVPARSGAEALRHLLDRDFAVILLDVRMPGMDGFEAARLIRGRERSRHTPIIFLTAMESPEFPVVEAYRLGAVDFLVKPLVPDILRAKVAGFVELYHKTEQVKRQADRLRRLERREHERRLAEQARREEERLRLIVENVRDYAIFMLDTGGHVATWNAGAQRQLGYPAEEVVGTHFGRFFTPEDVRAGLPVHELRQAADTGRSVDENWLVRKDGARFWANGVSTAVRDEAGRLQGFLKIFRDMSDQKALEGALRQRADELAERDRRKDEFLALLGHELRNPLAPLRTAAHLLQGAAADPAVVGQAAAIIERQVSHLARLVDDLLDVSRITHGKITLHKAWVSLRDAVTHAVETCRPLAETRGHRLEVALPAEPVWLEADPARLKQVLVNLLVNACKYTEPHGQVWLDAARDGGQVVVRVRDTGVGIPADMLDRVFEPFTQVDTSVGKASQWGLGIGLSLVKRLVEMHAGTVTAASAGPGRGSEFTIRLPLPEPGRVVVQDDVPEPVAAGRVLRILVVDDNTDLADSLAICLRQKGHQVRTAADGQAALDLAGRLRPEVVVLDLGLPGQDGFEVARRLAATPGLAGVPLVALTGYGREDDRRRAVEAGFAAFLVKPVEPDELERVLADVTTREAAARA